MKPQRDLQYKIKSPQYTSKLHINYLKNVSRIHRSFTVLKVTIHKFLSGPIPGPKFNALSTIHFKVKEV